MQRGHSHIEQRQGSLERGLCGEAHVALQQVHLCQVDWDHLRNKGTEWIVIRIWLGSALRCMNNVSCLYGASSAFPHGYALNGECEFINCHFLWSLEHFWIHEIKWTWKREIKYFIIKPTVKLFNCIIYQKAASPHCGKRKIMWINHAI